MVLTFFYFMIHYCCDNTWKGRAHRTPDGIRERHTCIGLMKSKILYENTIFTVELQIVSRTIVFRHKEIGDILCTKQREKVMILSNYSTDRNNTISSMFRTQYTPDFFVAEHCGLRNTLLPPGGLRISPLVQYEGPQSKFAPYG
jgi:hypothetical protein